MQTKSIPFIRDASFIYTKLYACKDDLNLRHFEIALMSDHLAKKASPNHRGYFFIG